MEETATEGLVADASTAKTEEFHPAAEPLNVIFGAIDDVVFTIYDACEVPPKVEVPPPTDHGLFTELKFLNAPATLYKMSFPETVVVGAVTELATCEDEATLSNFVV